MQPVWLHRLEKGTRLFSKDAGASRVSPVSKKCVCLYVQSCTNYNLVYISFLVNFGYGQDVSKGMNLGFHSIANTGPEITQACNHPL